MNKGKYRLRCPLRLFDVVSRCPPPPSVVRRRASTYLPCFGVEFSLVRESVDAFFDTHDRQVEGLCAKVSTRIKLFRTQRLVNEK